MHGREGRVRVTDFDGSVLLAAVSCRLWWGWYEAIAPIACEEFWVTRAGWVVEHRYEVLTERCQQWSWRPTSAE